MLWEAEASEESCTFKALRSCHHDSAKPRANDTGKRKRNSKPAEEAQRQPRSLNIPNSKTDHIVREGGKGAPDSFTTNRPWTDLVNPSPTRTLAKGGELDEGKKKVDKAVPRSMMFFNSRLLFCTRGI